MITNTAGGTAVTAVIGGFPWAESITIMAKPA
jgi:hypothetical protein